MLRVAITGVGVVSAAGADRFAFWESLAAGRSGIGPVQIPEWAPPLRFPHAAHVRDFDPARHFDPRGGDHLDRFAQFGVVAAREAVADAGVAFDDPRVRDRTAVVTGSCIGGQHAQEQAFYDLLRDGRKLVHPLTVPRVMPNAAASAIATEFGVRGQTVNLSTACASANHAMGLAFNLVRSGAAPMAIAGGAEAALGYVHLKAWESIRAVASDTCRPFCLGRRGMVLGEGAAMFVLEPLEAALARGAAVYAEVVGFGASADARHVTQPSADGAALAIAAAIEDAGIAPDRVGYVNAHGTGTPANDPMEACALRMVLGARLDAVPVSATKSIHGHAIGAAPALEAAATVLALRHRLLPPTANFTELDPDCQLDVVAHAARAAEPEYALSNSFAFGGLNAVLAFRRSDA
jgi:nodulation protein E